MKVSLSFISSRLQVCVFVKLALSVSIEPILVSFLYSVETLV